MVIRSFQNNSYRAINKIHRAIIKRKDKKINIEWIKCILKSRCRLNLINLDNEHFDNLIGVYLIWQGSDKHNVIEIGKGFIRERLAVLQRDKDMRKYAPDLFVTWAAVPTASLDGVEAFLYNELNPKVQHTITCQDLINVNLP